MWARQHSEVRLRSVLAAIAAGGEDVDTVVDTDTEEVRVALPTGLRALLSAQTLAGGASTAGSHELVVRPARAEDEKTLDRVMHYAFGMPGSPEGKSLGDLLETDESRIDTDATWGAFAGDMAVSQLFAHPWKLGGANEGCGMAAVSGVGTLPEFRRLGLLRTMMALLFRDMQAKGQPIAALGATQAAIYQRYGYAEAVRDVRSYSIDTVDIAFVDGDPGSCIVTRRDVDDELKGIMRPLYEQFIEGRCCAVGWDGAPGADWSSPHNKLFFDVPNALREKHASELSGNLNAAVATNELGEARGYCIYQIEERQDESHPTRSQKINVSQIIWADTDAYRSMLSFLARHDLVGDVTVRRLPSDDPTPTLLLEPRLLRTKVHEGSWWRIVDVVGALQSRRYDSYSSLLKQSPGLADILCLEVSDDERLAPWNIGTFLLELDCDGSATVRKLEQGSGLSAEVSVEIGALALLWAGTSSARELSMWEQLTAVDDMALAKTDMMFATKRAPFCFSGW
eukprot:COSAG02_NODE_6715_length_3404_cov_6.886233_3_plen_511_part_00